jgi:hypothetical protein
MMMSNPLMTAIFATCQWPKEIALKRRPNGFMTRKPSIAGNLSFLDAMATRIDLKRDNNAQKYARPQKEEVVA